MNDLGKNCGAALAAIILVVAGCGDGSGDKAEATKTITSEFLDIPTERGYMEASTPGSGGFIEIPQSRVPKGDRDRDRVDELGKAVPEIVRAPGSRESIFAGVHRDTYLRARAECRASSRRKLARDLRVGGTSRFAIAGAYAGDYRPALWVAAFEGCAVGISKRGDG